MYQANTSGIRTPPESNSRDNLEVVEAREFRAVTKPRTRKTDDQLKVLQEHFKKSRYPSWPDKLELSKKTGLEESKAS